MAVSLQSKMAANLEEMVTCVICTMRLQEPKHLQCQHSFCTQCLEEWMGSPSNLNSKTLPCPSCRHLTSLPSKGVEGLPADFNKNVLLDMLTLPTMDIDPQQCSTCLLGGAAEMAVSYCNDCEEHLCAMCLGNHNGEPALQDHCVIIGLRDELTATRYACDVHSGKKLAFYCPQCLHLICGICVRTAHLGHGALTIDEAVRVKKDALRDVLALIEQMRKSIERACPFKEGRDVDAMFESLREELHEHAQSAKLSVNRWLEQACKDLGKRQNILHTKMEKKDEYMAMLMSLRVYYEERLVDPDSRGLLAGFDELLSRAGPLLNQHGDAFSIPRWSFVPLVWPVHLGYLEKEDAAASPSVAAHVQPVDQDQHGALGETSSACGSCVEKGENGDERGRPPEMGCRSGDLRTLPVEGRRNSAIATGSAAESAASDSAEIEDVFCPGKGGGAVSTLMSPSLYGNAIVNGKLKCHPIKTWINASGNDDDDIITRASDVILGTADWLLVADASRGRVQRLWFDDLGRTPETVLQDATPRRMALSADGSIAITDQGYVHMLAVKCDVISARPKWTPLEMVQPFAIGFMERMQRIVLTDMHDRTVVVYDENLRHLASFGGPDTFGSPNCIWCDQRGRLLISDQTKNNVQAFSLAGEFLWKIDHLESFEPLVAPTAISLDRDGQIYIGCVDGRIGVYSTDGRFICHLVDQYETITNVRGISCRTDTDRTLVAVGGATSSDQSMVRLWQLPKVTHFQEFH